MKRAASRRSVRKPKRFAAGGASSFSTGGGAVGGVWSVSAMVVVWRERGSGGRAREREPGRPWIHCLVAALVENGLFVSGHLVEGRVRLLRAGDRRVDLGRVDVQELRVLGQVPEVL